MIIVMLKMLVLKMLMLKKTKKNKTKCIAIIYYKQKLSLFGKDDTKQANSHITVVKPFHCGPSSRTSSKS